MASDELINLAALLAAGRVTPETPIEAARAGYDAIGAMIPLVEGTTSEPFDGPVPGEWVRAPGVAPEPAILWLHGGGYVIGSPASHRPLASRISAVAGAPVLLLDYRLAPEAPHPAALDDATSAYRHLVDQGWAPERLALAGDSAGGGLTINAALRLRDRGDPLPAALACASPWVDLAVSGSSATTNADDDVVLSAELLHHWAATYLADIDPGDAAVSPLDASAAGLPPLLVHVARSEILYDDGVRLFEWAQRGGVEAALVVEDAIHHWHVWAGLLPEADAAVDELGGWLRERLGSSPRRLPS